jgi:hypothetical protein
MATVQDFALLFRRLQAGAGPHAPALLRAGVSVALDLHTDTARSRDSMRGLFKGGARTTGCSSSTSARRRASPACARNAKGGHRFGPAEAQFRGVSAHLFELKCIEGFHGVQHDTGG